MDASVGITPATPLDLIIIGGGINGAGIAADAAGRGLKVLICEQQDFASATSSASSKLIHGGLRYLEHYEFRLVKEALQEREVLLKIAPHLVKPMRFVLPHQPHLRPAWMIRTGLFLYDHLGKRESLEASRGVRFAEDSALDEKIKQGFEYADCWVDDARLVITNIQSAFQHGANIRNRTSFVEAFRENHHWKVVLRDEQTQQLSTHYTKGIVNAAGPWVANILQQNIHMQSPYKVRLIKGSHIVVPKLHNGSEAYILQNNDQRIVFVIPYLHDFSLIGTTDIEYKGDPRRVKISATEIDYLINITNNHFKQHISEADIVYSYAGVRPLCDDESSAPSAITRDYTLTIDHQDGHTPLLSVFGGKITTYRKLAEAAMEKLIPYFANMEKPWTQHTPLPGGDLSEGVEGLQQQLEQALPWLEPKIIDRYVHSYGHCCYQFLEGIQGPEMMGPYFGAGLYGCEVDYLVKHEWVNQIDDILWRRTKVGLLINRKQYNHLAYYLEKQHNLVS
ncbi:glycerol-3-phosphate dehydrogenase [Endozoicomonas sp. SM1973]|uniref:Glycerol-3-phosphate dehydrogenase n=1 Tax=Spartinivicinus marinus TaxID=2994442 RepID=A0A853IC48_9GAMM|nr:glycerol-3-phosphate dehydrogenase [Spartinivicinus marinus]MCX4028646.1 glycerol-3-phosphate dehydrogenase [Spartinivicinus marinus]NYZ67087.1 glycerol-3-phosphate dehydrogenase [Spartinivicinus marinus]